MYDTKLKEADFAENSSHEEIKELEKFLFPWILTKRLQLMVILDIYC